MQELHQEFPAMQALAYLVRVLADATRLGLLTQLCHSEATVSDLTVCLGLPQPRISSHLTVLRRAGLVAVQSTGRQRVYRVDVPRTRALLTALGALLPAALPPRSAQAAREVRQNTPMRQGRSCYDHLAGVLGVQLLDRLVQRGWLQSMGEAVCSRYGLTAAGEQALRVRGVPLERARAARRRFACGCLDWTERRAHLGGALGAVLLDTLLRAGVVRRQPGSRTLTVQTPLDAWLEP